MRSKIPNAVLVISFPLKPSHVAAKNEAKTEYFESCNFLFFFFRTTGGKKGFRGLLIPPS